MSEQLNLILRQSTFGPEDISNLIAEWEKDLFPKTINDLATLYLHFQLESETEYFVYDQKKKYSVGNHLIVRSSDSLHLAEVIEVKENEHYKGDTYDKIRLKLLDEQAVLGGINDKFYVSNYHGQELRVRPIKEFELLTEEDLLGIISQLYTVLPSDDRIVDYSGKWFLKSHLTKDLDTNDFLKLFSSKMEPLTTDEIINYLYEDGSNGENADILSFSINLYLDSLEAFETHSLHPLMWDLKIPNNFIEIRIENNIKFQNIFPISKSVSQILLYNGYLEECNVVFPSGIITTVKYIINEQSLEGGDFVSELSRLVNYGETAICLHNPVVRGDPLEISLPSPDSVDKLISKITLKEEWINSGIIKLTKKIADRLNQISSLHVNYDEVDEIKPYNYEERVITELDGFYKRKNLEATDIVILNLGSGNPLRLYISTKWKKSLNSLFKLNPSDLNWQDSSLRDCIIVYLNKFKKPLHYKNIYAGIATHRILTIYSVISCLSKHSPSIFMNEKRGYWRLSNIEYSRNISDSAPGENHQSIIISDSIWAAIAEIEDGDMVYRLLQKLGKPLDFSQICKYLAKDVDVNPVELEESGFLEGNDNRFIRLDDGSWALDEWLANEETNENEKTFENHQTIIQAFLSFNQPYVFIMLILFLAIILIILTLFFMN